MSIDAPISPEPAVAVVTPDQGVGLPQPLNYELENQPASVDKAVAKAQAALKAKGTAAAENAKKALEERNKPDHARRSEAVKGAIDKVHAEQEAKDAAADRYREPPHGFRRGLEKEWASTPDSVREEVHRRVQNLENGFQKHRQSAEAYESVREFDHLARQNGGNLRASLEKVVEIENAFTRNPVEGFQRICDHFGLSVHAVATHIARMSPDHLHAYQQQSQVQETTARMQALETQNRELMQLMKANAIKQDVEAFAQQHSRFDELSDLIAQELQTGRYSLEEAYERAEKLAGPANGAGGGKAGRNINPAGLKSIAGAPSSGSDYSSRPKGKAPSTSEAVRNALARMGR